eukprot:TRINITY_DN26740_c0_g1_i1.p2 TRINITY_DN26740_c0_g1~~TRINITY_DN26740_c0_g1_i1.p2  ORF type:complete len:100 (-),score=21.28 TRINITY_DN26740_c0_g1_i1:17-316(-)
MCIRDRDIVRCNSFVVRFESSLHFSATLFNETLLEANGFFIVATETSPLNKWTHVAIGNSEAIPFTWSAILGIASLLSLIHICRCRRYAVCKSRWEAYQ